MHRLKRFLAERAGNVTMLFALSVVPIFGFVSLSIDYTRASVAKDRLQSMVDAAALAGASLPGSITPEEVEQRVGQMLQATSASDRLLRRLVFDIEADSLTVGVRVDGNIDSSFARLLGVNQINLAAFARAQRPRTAKADIALVLDNTGSMNFDGRLTALKNAVSHPQTGLTAALRRSFSARPNDVRVSVIPFSVGVRLSPVSAALAAVVAPAPGVGWSGCVADRNANHDVNNVMPVASDPSTFLPRQHPNRSTVQCPGTPVTPLTTNLNAVDSQINAMVAQGNTNTTVGLWWGRQSLQQGGLLPGVPRAHRPISRAISSCSRTAITRKATSSTMPRRSTTRRLPCARASAAMMAS